METNVAGKIRSQVESVFTQVKLVIVSLRISVSSFSSLVLLVVSTVFSAKLSDFQLSYFFSLELAESLTSMVSSSTAAIRILRLRFHFTE